jgi:segregation and condensation protein A
MPDYRVELETFRGPLDLLLFLVKRNEVDIFDIPIAKITEQFCAYTNLLQQIDVEMAGEFLVMAATLMEIKSRMLLPHDTAATDDSADPRAELVKQLVEYRKFKDAAANLESRAEAQSTRLTRSAVDEPTGPGAPPSVRPVELWDLVSAFGRIMRDAELLHPPPIIVDDTPQHVYQQQIRQALKMHGRSSFRDLFMPPYTRSRLLGIFLAILELIRMGLVFADQDERYGNVWLDLRPDAPEDVISIDSTADPEPAAESDMQPIAENR